MFIGIDMFKYLLGKSRAFLQSPDDDAMPGNKDEELEAELKQGAQF